MFSQVSRSAFVMTWVGMAYILVVPFSKVEESFNTQAIHDILFHHVDLASYDHHEFPGVVPRTFLGPVVISSILSPVRLVDKLLGSPLDKFAYQYLARLVLLGLVIHALQRLSLALKTRFGDLLGECFLLITSFQFHIMFYSSRTLPNTFALVLTTHATASWYSGQYHSLIAFLAIASTVFRCDIAVLAVPLVLTLVLSGKLNIFRASLLTIAYSLLALAITVPIDSIFWGRWLWPEGVVLWFNTAENRSSEWGTSPFLWYFLKAIPKSMTTTLFLVPLGLYANLAQLEQFMVSFIYVFLYSFLPHKELRFIFPVIPILNSIAASGAAFLLSPAKKRTESDGNRVLRQAILVILCVSALIISMLLLYVSMHNYPGGRAFRRLAEEEPGSVHIDAHSCMTGVTRFGELRSGWIYSKEEGEIDHRAFDYLITSNDTLISEIKRENLPEGCVKYIFVHIEHGFAGIEWRKFRILLEDDVYVLKRNATCAAIIRERKKPVT